MKKAKWLKDRRKGVWVFNSVCRSLDQIQQFHLPVLLNFFLTADIAKEEQKRSGPSPS
jgi:hypothetical protein